MSRVEVKKTTSTMQCACSSHMAKYEIIVKGISATSKAELALCDECFKHLKKQIKSLDR